MRSRSFASACVLASFAGSLGCGGPRNTSGSELGDADETGLPTGVGSADEGSGSGSSGAVTTDDGAPTTRLDLPEDATGGDVGGGPTCSVVHGGDAIPECDTVAPPDSFDLATEWQWNGDGVYTQSLSIPLVANLTDDNGDGNIDLCDTPDVIMQVYENVIGGDQRAGRLVALDGATGNVHWIATDGAGPVSTPALGDVDGDGLVEIVVVSARISMEEPRIRIFEHDGTVKLTSTELVTSGSQSGGHGAIALGDVDNDGDTEILLGQTLWSHDGDLLLPADRTDTVSTFVNASVLADLDGDNDLELVLGRSAYHHDGTEIFKHEDMTRGMPQVADLDDDGLPEILMQSSTGMTLLEHDGTIKVRDVQPFPAEERDREWLRPSALHDMDGDGEIEIAVSVADRFAVYERDLSSVWSVGVQDKSGASAGTAFDFLGDGSAEAMYADETQLYVYGDGGQVLLRGPRTSRTSIEYPIVVDVDNDQSAEILMVSSRFGPTQSAPTLQVFGDVDDRWIQARRIWNQHTYHVTNVFEDGTIPRVEAPHWRGLNTFRTNAQIQRDGATCKPTPVG